MKTRFEKKINIIENLIKPFGGKIINSVNKQNDLVEAEVFVNDTKLLFTSKGWNNTITVGLTKPKLIEMATDFCSKFNLIYAQNDVVKIRYISNIRADFNNFIRYRNCQPDLFSQESKSNKVEDFKKFIDQKYNFEIEYNINNKSKADYTLKFSILKFNFNIINNVGSISGVNKFKDLDYLDQYKSNLSNDFKLLKFKNKFLDDTKDLIDTYDINRVHSNMLIKELNYIKSEVVTRYTDKVIEELNSEFLYK